MDIIEASLRLWIQVLQRIQAETRKLKHITESRDTASGTRLTQLMPWVPPTPAL